MGDEDEEEGFCGGHVVHMEDDTSQVLGPDGEPLRFSRRVPIGFDLTRRAKQQRGQGK